MDSKLKLHLCLIVICLSAASSNSTPTANFELSICESKPPEAKLPHPSDCSRYFRCLENGSSLSGLCEPHQRFVEAVGACVPLAPNSRNCSNEFLNGRATPSQEAILTDPSYSCISNNTYFISHPQDCKKYIICHGGNPVEWDCSKEMHFNPDVNMCVGLRHLPPNAACLQNPEMSTLATVLATRSMCATVPDKTYIEDTEDCEWFYYCLNGLAYPRKCHHGMYFDPSTSTCARPSQPASTSQCLTKATAKKPKAPIVSHLCQYEPNTTYTAHPGDCSKFYICYEKLAYEYRCPMQLVFNELTQLCDYPENLPKGSLCLQDPAKVCLTLVDGTYIRDRLDCGSFYICYGATPHAYTCPGKLLYNPANYLCVEPERLPPAAPCSPNGEVKQSGSRNFREKTSVQAKFTTNDPRIFRTADDGHGPGTAHRGQQNSSRQSFRASSVVKDRVQSGNELESPLLSPTDESFSLDLPSSRKHGREVSASTDKRGRIKSFDLDLGGRLLSLQ